MLVAMSKSIHKTHIHLIIVQHYVPFPRITLAQLGEKTGNEQVNLVLYL